jgi:hypothetical protein
MQEKWLFDFPVKSVRFVENCLSATNFPNIGKTAYESKDCSFPMQEFGKTKLRCFEIEFSTI